MRIAPLHTWDLTPKEAIALQKELAGRVDASRPLRQCELIAGADVSYNRFSPIVYAAIVVLRASDLTIVETQDVVGESRFPYIPGLLTFREAPIVLDAFAKLRHRPDVVMVDGQGLAHPRRFGIASHLGLLLGVPTIGCAKTRLIGEFKEPLKGAGAISPLLAPAVAASGETSSEIIGSVVRTKLNTRPLYISVGHMIDLASAVGLVLASCRGYRIPEPTRQAHLRVNEIRRQAQK
jgi:deoxyribonuclease V